MIAEKPVGIDLGTTNSAMAWVDEFGPQRDDPQRRGRPAHAQRRALRRQPRSSSARAPARAATAHPDLVAQWVKRDMGAPFYSHPIRGEYLPPEVIQACILRKLKTDIVAAVGPEAADGDHRAGLFRRAAPQGDGRRRRDGRAEGRWTSSTSRPPPRWPSARRWATLLPTGMPREEMTVMVYDLGGGTFDVTLLRLAAGNIHTLATDGDVQLGGHDWDERLVDYAAEAFRKSHGVDPREDPAALNRLYQVVMEAKHSLSARSRDADPRRVSPAGRSKCRHPRAVRGDDGRPAGADRLHVAATAGRRQAGVEGRQRGILLVGGSTRMPMVARDAAEAHRHRARPHGQSRRGRGPRRGALCPPTCWPKQGQAARDGGFKVTNVNAHSLGIEGIEPETLRKTNVILIPRNTPLPAKLTERFVTKSEGQRSIVVQVLEGESSLPGECTAIGRTVIRDLPDGLPKGWPVEVTLRVRRRTGG